MFQTEAQQSTSNGVTQSAVAQDNERIKNNILQNVLGTEMSEKVILSVAKQLKTESELKCVAIALDIENASGLVEGAIRKHNHNMKGAALDVLTAWRHGIADHDTAWNLLVNALHEEVPSKLCAIFYNNMLNKSDQLCTA